MKKNNILGREPSAESRDNLPTYDETKLKFLVLLFLLFPIGNLTVQVKRPVVKGALIPYVWEFVHKKHSDTIINHINWETNQQNPNQAHIDFFNIKKKKYEVFWPYA